MILEQIAEKTKERVAEQKKIISPAEYRTKAEVARAEEFRSKTARTEMLNDAVNSEGAGNPFYSALAEPGISFICEVKKASPSKGVIAEHFPYLEYILFVSESGMKTPQDLLDSGKGSGETFRWSLMEDAVGESEIAFEKSIFLAGGIHPGNIHEAIRNVHPYCIDVSSGAETDGVKDPVKMKALVEAVRNIGV